MGRANKAPPWRRRFLRALARGANARLAAREAEVDHSSAYYHRQRDAKFAAAWERAVAKGRARTDKPPPRPSAARGRERPELVVRRSRDGGVQLVQAGAGRWNAGAEERFFAELGRTACVERAAEAAGFSTTALYNRRKRYPDFAEKWRIAEDEALARLHRLVVAAGIARFDRTASWGEGLPPVSMSEAIAILRLKGPSAPSGSGGAGGGARHGIEEPSIDQVRDEVLRRLAALRRQRDGDSGAGEEG